MAQAMLKPLNEDDCLATERQATVRLAFMHGCVHAMAGSGANHLRVAGHLQACLLACGDNNNSNPFMRDVKLCLDFPSRADLQRSALH